jgi:hypothetical protein
LGDVKDKDKMIRKVTSEGVNAGGGGVNGRGYSKISLIKAVCSGSSMVG